MYYNKTLVNLTVDLTILTLPPAYLEPALHCELSSEVFNSKLFRGNNSIIFRTLPFHEFINGTFTVVSNPTVDFDS